MANDDAVRALRDRLMACSAPCNFYEAKVHAIARDALAALEARQPAGAEISAYVPQPHLDVQQVGPYAFVIKRGTLKVGDMIRVGRDGLEIVYAAPEPSGIRVPAATADAARGAPSCPPNCGCQAVCRAKVAK